MTDRVLDWTDGVAMVVTDLHGDGDAFAAYRDRFLSLRSQGAADRLLLCGDVIHGDGPAHRDESLSILLEVIRLQEDLGPEAVVMLLGNHELPHIYGLPLSRGSIEYTPRFEASLSQAGGAVRSQVLAFLEALPFFVRTAAGVMVTHCGASRMAALPHSRQRLLSFSHQEVLRRWEAAFSQEDTEMLRRGYEKSARVDYEQDARHYLAVQGPQDPRYWHLLRSLSYNRNDPDFGLLWETFFTRNEQDSGGEGAYRETASRFLEVWSAGAPAPQKALVAGHIAVHGGYHLVNPHHLRIASWAHAHPREAGVYLLLDCAAPVDSAADLISHLGSVFV